MSTLSHSHTLFDYSGFVVSFNIGKCESLNCVLFKDWSIWSPLQLFINFRIVLFVGYINFD